MNQNVLDSIIRDYVAEGSGLESKVVVSTTVKTPDTSIYAVVSCQSANFSQPWTMHNEGSNPPTWNVVRNAELFYSIQWWGENSMNYGTAFRTWIDSPLGLQYATDRNFSCSKCSEVRNLDFSLPDDEGGEIQDRCNLDLTISITLTEIQEIPAIEPPK